MRMPSPLMIANAWQVGVGDQRWFTRRNKEHDHDQWEVVHDWGGALISDDTMKVVARFSRQDDADYEARHLERIARATAVIEQINEYNKGDPDMTEAEWRKQPGPWAHLTTEQTNKLIATAVAAEREACARIASGMDLSTDCDDRGATDPETGEVPCSAEARGEVCVCVERSDLAHKIATKIRARATT